MQSNADMELELDRADPGGGEKNKKRNDAKILGECGWCREKEGEGKNRVKNITGLSSRPSYGDERRGAGVQCDKSLHYMVSRGTWGN